MRLLEQAKVIGWGHIDCVPESDQLYTNVYQAAELIDSAYIELMDLSKSINPDS
jgi:hypothetical protein